MLGVILNLPKEAINLLHVHLGCSKKRYCGLQGVACDNFKLVFDLVLQKRVIYVFYSGRRQQNFILFSAHGSFMNFERKQRLTSCIAAPHPSPHMPHHILTSNFVVAQLASPMATPHHTLHQQITSRHHMPCGKTKEHHISHQVKLPPITPPHIAHAPASYIQIWKRMCFSTYEK